MINTIQIITINNFDSSHAALSDITHYFRLYMQFEFYDINTYLSELSNEIIIHRDSLMALPYPLHEFEVLLMKPPEIGENHQFIVQAELTDGRILRDTTEQLKLF